MKVHNYNLLMGNWLSRFDFRFCLCLWLKHCHSIKKYCTIGQCTARTIPRWLSVARWANFSLEHKRLIMKCFLLWFMNASSSTWDQRQNNYEHKNDTIFLLFEGWSFGDLGTNSAFIIEFLETGALREYQTCWLIHRDDTMIQTWTEPKDDLALSTSM